MLQYFYGRSTVLDNVILKKYYIIFQNCQFYNKLISWLKMSLINIKYA